MFNIKLKLHNLLPYFSLQYNNKKHLNKGQISFF